MVISSKCFAKSDDLATRDIAGETIIVPVKNNVGDLNSIYTLNEIGTFIWRLIDGATSTTQIVNAICEEYDVQSEEAEKDVVTLTSSLEAAGLVRSPE